MSFTPDSCARDKDKPRYADAQQVVSGEQGDVGEGLDKVDFQQDAVRGQQRRQGRCNDGEQAEDSRDEVATPERPVERIARVVAGLRDENGAVLAPLEDGILWQTGGRVGEIFEGGGTCRAGVLVACDRMVGTQRGEADRLSARRACLLTRNTLKVPVLQYTQPHCLFFAVKSGADCAQP